MAIETTVTLECYRNNVHPEPVSFTVSVYDMERSVEAQIYQWMLAHQWSMMRYPDGEPVPDRLLCPRCTLAALLEEHDEEAD